MPRFKSINRDQVKLIPVNYEEQIQPGTFEFSIDHIVDTMDLSIFDERYCNDEVGASAYQPRVLLKIVLLGYSRGLLSSRKIAQACRDQVTFMALSADSHPHFTTIAGFVSSMGEEIAALFREVLLVCADEGLIGRHLFAVDGCKISSNAAKEWSGTREDLAKRMHKFEESIRLLLERHRGTDDEEQRGGVRQAGRDEEIARAVARLDKKREKIERFLAENDDKIGSRGQPIQSNVTDNDSAKMPSSRGVIQGYNSVAMVDGEHQVIVEAEAFGDGEDSHLFAPMVEGTRENFREIGQTEDVFTDTAVVGDNGFHSEATVQQMIEEAIAGVIADNRFRKRDPRFATAGRHKKPVDRHKKRRTRRWFLAAEFTLDEANGKLICPAGKELYVKNRNFATTDGHRGIAYQAKKTDCRVCTLRKKCLRHDHTESRQVVKFVGRVDDAPKSFTQQMIERFDTPEGRQLYSRRLGIVEPVFANIRSTLRMHRFTLRSKMKVNVQWKLYCMVHNIGKLMRYAPGFA